MSTTQKVFFSRRVPYAIETFQKKLLTFSSASKVEIICHTSEEERISREEFLHQVKGCTGIFCLLTERIDEEVLEHAGPQLKVVSTMSVGYNHIDIAACKKRHIQVGYTPGVLDISTAETAVALTFAVKRKLFECNQSARHGQWGVWQPFQYCGTDISKSTVGIIGLGRIGTTYARMMSHGFNCQILYTGPNEKTSNASTVGSNVQYCSLEELLEKSDIVSLHLPLNESTQHFFNANCFKRMKSNAIVINTSRGEIIDQEALYLALKNKEIAGAGLDVTTPEPLPPSHPLFGVQNCIILPHIGSATIKTRQAMADIAIQNLLAGIFQQELLHSVR